jgi:DNA repair photolyase
MFKNIFTQGKRIFRPSQQREFLTFSTNSSIVTPEHHNYEILRKIVEHEFYRESM